MKILAIVNPRAGGGRAVRLLPQIQDWLRDSPHDIRWSVSESPAAARSLILESSGNGTQGVLVLGGDGTLHEVLSGLEQTGLPFGLIPCGRGNDFSRNIGLPLDIKACCDFPAEPGFLAIDLPRVNGVAFGSIACLGFDAAVNRLAREGKGLLGGSPGYFICVLRALRTFRPIEARVEVDQFSWQGRLTMVAVANGPYYGGGMKIAPAASMSDGLFDICIIREISKAELVRQFPKVYAGRHINHFSVIMKSGSAVRVSADGDNEIFADGEPSGTAPAEWTIRKQALRVMLPGAAGREGWRG